MSLLLPLTKLFTPRALPGEVAPQMPRYRSSPAVRSSVHERGIVLFHTHTGKILQANLTGAFIWESIRQGKSPLEISEQLALDQSTSQAQAKRDTEVFLTLLENAQIVHRVGVA